MKNYVVNRLQSQPGIQRDSTRYDSNAFIDGQWCRFYNGQPRKIGGYAAVDIGNTKIIRDMFAIPNGPNVSVYLGREDSLAYITLPPNNNVDPATIEETDRTPTSLFAPDPENSWSMTLFTSASNTFPNPQLVAQVTTNASNINNDTEGYIFYGDIKTNTPLIPITDTSELTPGPYVTCSGGVVYVAPVLVAYGNNGVIRWTNEGELLKWQNEVDSQFTPNSLAIANTKIVYGIPIIGAQAPTALFWSINSLIRASYIPITNGTGTTINQFSATTIEDNISILSANCVVRYQQMFFWPGVDQFYQYDGVVRPIPNTMNRDWFFNNLNYMQRNKVFGISIPRYDEIWWFYPTEDSEENNAVVIYNVVNGFWFDSKIGRASGVQTSLFPKPLMADNVKTQTLTRQGPLNTYILWQHETGTDKVVGDQSYAIKSFHSYNIIDLLTSAEGNENRLLRTRRIEPDYLMTGTMTATITNLMFANDVNNGDALTEGPFVFNQNTQKIDTSSQGRQLFITFTSNMVGGYYQGGKTLYDWMVGDLVP